MPIWKRWKPRWPLRLAAVEQVLNGNKIDEAVIAKANDEARRRGPMGFDTDVCHTNLLLPIDWQLTRRCLATEPGRHRARG